MATEVKFKISADTAKAIQGIEKFTKATEKNTKQAVGALSQIQKQTTALSQTLNVFAGQVLANATTKAFSLVTNAAKGLFDVLITEGITAATDQEDAIAQLNQALRASGQFSNAASKDLQEFASHLQENSKFADETIVNTQALIQSLGQLSTEGLKGATQATVDLASALRIDLNTAALLVGKAAAGEIGSFSRYGLVIKSGANNAETFANALDAINAKFGGAAAAQVKTFTGATTQLKNTFGDLQELFGQVITENPAVIAVFNTLNSVFKSLQGSVQNNQESLKLFIQDGILLILNTVPTAISFIQGFADGFLSLKKTITGFLVFSVKVVEFINSAAVSIDKFIGNTEGLKKSEGAAKSLTSTIQFLEQSIVDTHEAQFNLNQVFDEAKVKSDEFTIAVIDSINQQKQAKIAAQEELSAAGANSPVVGGQLTEEQIVKEIELLQERNQLISELQDEHLQAELAKNEEHIQRNLGLLKKDSTDQLKVRKKLKDDEDAINKQRLDFADQFFGNMASLMRTNDKTLFEIGKRSAQAQAIVNVAQGITKALSFGPILGPILAASIAVAGAVQIAAIESQKLAGGITEIPKGFNENIPGRGFLANMSSGERVISKNQNEDLKQFIKDGGGSKEVLGMILNKLENMTTQVIVNIGEKEIVNVLRDSLRSGRVLQVSA